MGPTELMTQPPDSDVSASAYDAESGAPLDPYSVLLERLAESSSSRPGPERSAAALRRGADHPDPDLEASWQDRLSAAASQIGFDARGVWLSPAEVAGTLRPDMPVVTYRRSDANPSGWTMLLDRRWGKVLQADLVGHAKDAWTSIDDLAERVEADRHTRIPWLVCDPTLPTVAPAKHGPATPPLRRLIQLIQPDRSDLWSVVMFAVIVGALTLAIPIAVQQLVNSVALGGLLQPVVVLALLLFAVLSFSAVLSAIEAYVVEILQRRVFVRVASDIARRLPRVQLAAFDGRHGPELVNRFFDVMTVQKVGASLLLDGTALVLQAVIGLIVLGFYHPLMLAFGVVLLLGISVIVWIFGRGAVNSAIIESKSKYAVIGWLQEVARHTTEFRTSWAERLALERADDLSRTYLHARKDHYRIVFRQLAGALGLQVLASSALLALGGGLVIVGQLTLGQLVASELIVTAIVASFAKLGKHLEGYYDLLAAVDKLGILFDLPLEREDGDVYESDNPAAAMRFNDVTFKYGAKSVVDKLQLEIEPGQRIALLGPSGSGKSTVFDLALGLRSPTSGYITLDGVDLGDLRLETVREQIVRVSGPDIIEGSLEENVRMGRTHVNHHSVREALAAVGMLDQALKLPDGLRTKLATGGSPLSRGAAMRVTLARAIAGNPRLVLLDAPLAYLDEHPDEPILEKLFSSDMPWSLLVATTRAEDGARCDHVIQLPSPRIDLSGNNPREGGDSNP